MRENRTVNGSLLHLVPGVLRRPIGVRTFDTECYALAVRSVHCDCGVVVRKRWLHKASPPRAAQMHGIQKVKRKMMQPENFN